jgi:CRISPR-associated exonuclease Cas4
MLSTNIPEAEFFYGKIRRRVPVEMDTSLRQQTEDVVQRVRDLLSKQIVPRMEYHSQCRSCSLEQICMPKVLNEKKIKNYLHQLYTQEL